jgi:hypothetical protein
MKFNIFGPAVCSLIRSDAYFPEWSMEINGYAGQWQ